MKIIVGAPEEMYLEKKFDNLLGLDQVGQRILRYKIKLITATFQFDILSFNETLEVVLDLDRRRDIYNLNLTKPKISIERMKFYNGVGNLQTIIYVPDANLMCK